MAAPRSVVTRRIGLSLGADLCWPACYEEIVRRLDLEIPVRKERIRFEVERVTIEPFSLAQPVKYDVVLDRLTHWYHTSREWVKKAVVMNDVYVLNNPFSIQANEKHTTYAAMMRLGLPVPETWMIPPKEYEWTQDLRITLRNYAKLFDLGKIGEKIGYPMFMKPYDGGAWVGVSKIDDEAALKEAYEKSGKRVMHLQKAVSPFDLFVRCIGIGPQTRVIKYDASAPLHARYTAEKGFVTDEEARLMREMTLTINAFFGWDFNSCEALRRDGVFYPIDFANACPDSQVTSLHYHFPWLVLSKIRWSLFVAATKRPMRHNLDWAPFFEVAREDLPFREKLRKYADIAEKRLEADRFEEFCAKHLAHLPEVAHEFFASQICREAVRGKVAQLFPAHEVEQFTEHFFAAIQRWREEEGRPS
ncbi:MAG: hypothetical protein HMLKMBBP_01156 [Planctomycetes bacterium]|nr:hypothetical protein [Planctomycetota bacterium]